MPLEQWEMEVTFNNVLEGARQYFQGLPTTTPNANYPINGENQIAHYGAEQKQDRAPSSSSSSTISYWPPHPESQMRPQTLDTSQHSAETARLPIQNQNVTQEHHQSSSSYHSQPTHQEQAVPTSHGYQYNSRVHPQQYQSHIIPNPSYHPTPAQVPSRVHEQSYHQLQPQAQTEQSYTNYQQARPYYPVYTQAQQQPQTYQHSYQVASTQAYSQPVQPSYSNHTYNTHSQNLFTSDTNYTTKTTKPEVNPPKPTSQNQQQQQQQPYRTTHNLPPIAALSHVNYHSSRSRDVMRSTAIKSRPAVPTETTTTQQRTPSYNVDYLTAQQTRPAVNQSYQYSNSGTVSHSYSVPTPHQSSTNPTYQPAYTAQVAYHQPVNSTDHETNSDPLDLSVKTVRTPADSTLDDSKYYHASRQPVQAPVLYHSYNHYNNSTQQNVVASKAGAPKVDFSPNFNIPPGGQQQMSFAHKNMYHRHSNVTVAHGSSNPVLVSTLGSSGSTPSAVSTTPTNANLAFNNHRSIMQPSKKTTHGLPRIDFLKSAKPSGETVKKRNGDPVPPMVPNKIQKVDMWRQTIDQQIEQKLSSYTKSRLQQEQPSNKLVNGSNFDSSSQNRTYQGYPTGHNQTYIPTPAPHQYPGYAQQAPYPQHSIHRTNSNPCLPVTNRGAADRRVLSLLRNSLEIKGAKEARKKLEQEQQHIQQPSTGVMAPLQPKPGVVGRHNMSPFAATSLYEPTTTTYKFHLPKAVDSIKLEGDDTRIPPTVTNTNTDLDGLAAFLAARIRTKAELKQVGSAHNNELTRSMSESQLCKPKQTVEFSPQRSASPPKLTHEQLLHLPRRKLFNKTEGDVRNAPPRDKTGLRSSSETSVFDFPDSDSETEMPVLERQSLVDMRKDRKTLPKTIPSDVDQPPLDISFENACDNFVEQLKSRVLKKRGRRKKLDVTAEVKMEIKEEPKTQSDSDSDTPLINHRKVKSENDAIKKEISSDVETDEEITKTCKKLEKSQALKIKSLPEKTYGDGSDFYPGWEEEVYKYKRSLRMPAALIHVTRPPHWHRLSTSLPDLDSHTTSPSPSENTDFKPKLEPDFDSEADTNSNFSFSLGNGAHRETTSPPKPKRNSILARLIERCGTRKRRKTKKKVEEYLPKIIPKSKNEFELLPTPGLEIQTVPHTKNKELMIIKEESALLGFRKKTIDNFKDAFINSSNSLLGINEQFKTVVMKSRTRLETRTLKQKTTIKEVFGDDRPASAPPVSCVDGTEKQPDDNSNKNQRPTNPKLLETSGDLLKSIAATKIISVYDEFSIKDECKSETPSVDGDDCIIPTKKRMKYIRRKFSSGFDYIRKKKKLIKKENTDLESATKPKRRGAAPKASPESIQDIQKEIKMWVMNKGIGETHLHRAARCGYTDITAYCLEKMEGTPTPKDNAGYTPLHEACARGHLAIAKLLLLYGANVSESAQGGIRPLHEAAENGFVEIVRLLLSYGADPLLATYGGLTPLTLATDEMTIQLLQNHIADIQGHPSAVWTFMGPASMFDSEDTGYNPLETVPSSDQCIEEEDFDFELSNTMLPNLYTIRGEPQSERWVLLQDLSHILKIKSRDTLLKQICPISNSTNTNYKSVLRELKMSDFLEKATCCQYLCAGEKINTRASKVALVKYSDKVRQLLGVEKYMITLR